MHCRTARPLFALAALVTAVLAPSAAAGPGPSGNATGACCVIGASGATTCSVTTPRACAQSRGHYRGDNTTCATDGACPPLPPAPTGACCTTTAGATTCAVTTARACNQARGKYQGNNVACGAGNACPPKAACCFTNGACSISIEARCTAAGGTFNAASATCRPVNPCPQPARGACCITHDDHAHCLVTTQARCTAASGTYQGDASACTATTCPDPATGACCIAATQRVGQHCITATQARCARASGTYAGDNSTCAAITTCPVSCPCDWNRDGRLTVQDTLAFLNDWLAGTADFNNSGATDRADLVDFNACAQSAPTGCFRPQNNGNGNGNGPGHGNGHGHGNGGRR